jgi:hypothetical protein
MHRKATSSSQLSTRFILEITQEIRIKFGIGIGCFSRSR